MGEKAGIIPAFLLPERYRIPFRTTPSGYAECAGSIVPSCSPETDRGRDAPRNRFWQDTASRRKRAVAVTSRKNQCRFVPQPVALSPESGSSRAKRDPDTITARKRKPFRTVHSGQFIPDSPFRTVNRSPCVHHRHTGRRSLTERQRDTAVKSGRRAKSVTMQARSAWRKRPRVRQARTGR